MTIQEGHQRVRGGRGVSQVLTCWSEVESSFKKVALQVYKLYKFISCIKPCLDIDITIHHAMRKSRIFSFLMLYLSTLSLFKYGVSKGWVLITDYCWQERKGGSKRSKICWGHTWTAPNIICCVKRLKLTTIPGI